MVCTPEKAQIAARMRTVIYSNPGDSAAYYNFQALDIYNETGDITGKGRAYYCPE